MSGNPTSYLNVSNKHEDDDTIHTILRFPTRAKPRYDALVKMRKWYRKRARIITPLWRLEDNESVLGRYTR